MKLIRIGAGALAAIVLATWLLDAAVFHIRSATGRSCCDTVTVRELYAVPHKNKSTEFVPGETHAEPCVHALFPHAGHSPCWYLTNHAEQRIDL